MLLKATGSDLISHSSHWFTHHPIILHWRVFSWLIPLSWRRW